MNEQQLRENLRRLPEARAGDGFTEAVLARLQEADETRRTPWLRPALAAAAVAALVAVAVLVAGVLPPAAGPAPERQTASRPPAAAPPAGDRVAGAGAVETELPRQGAPQPAEGSAAEESAPARSRAEAAPDPRAVRRLAELRRERERLRAQLAALEAMPREEPKLLLAGDETVELVLDLGRTARLGPNPVEPARYPGGGGPRFH